MSVEVLRALSVSEDVASYFEAEGLMTPITNNKRKISTSTISPENLRFRTPTPSSSSNPSISPENFKAAYIREEVDVVEVPARLKSQETYEYLGFTRERAAELWTRYLTYGDEIQGDFLDFAIWQAENDNYPDASSQFDDWDALMKSLDINDQLREAILLPEYENIRYTATCKYWLVDAIKMAFEALEDLNEKLRDESRRRQQHNKARGRRSVGQLAQTPTLPYPTSRKAPNIAFGPRTTDGAAEDEMSGGSQMQLATIASATLVGHTILWRSVHIRRAESFYNVSTQAIDLFAMSSIPGDFNAEKQVTYFTPQKETADRYAQWAKHKIPLVEMAMVQVAVSETLTNTLDTKFLWFGDKETVKDEWKKMIWTCRNGKLLPADLKYLQQKDVLIGHVASGINAKYQRKANYEDISESDLLTVDIDGEERRAIQWVFHTEKARAGFEDQCRGKIWIHRFAPLKVPKQD